MQKKLLPSLAAAVIGAGLLVGASFAGSAGSADPARAGGAEAKRGGTLRINLSTTDFEFLDPALSYEAPGWQVLYMTNLMLLNYPDKPAPEGSRLVPDAATGLPRISSDGRTYTFTIKQRPSLQRRLGGDRSSVQARLRARREPAAGLTRDRVPARRRRRRRAQRRQGGLGQPASSRTVRR